ncbi:MAG: hypothetical protein PF505_03535 [Vallitaleaceae bacterium]|nr:hypothetical protein [Vallitaleaceae bacterium]
MRRIKYIMIALVILIYLCSTGCDLPYKDKEVIEVMSEYMEDTYEQEFDFEDLEQKTGDYGMKWFEATAISEDGIECMVTWYPTNGGDIISDYHNVRWDAELSQLAQDDFEKYYSPLEVSFMVSGGEDTLTMSLDEMIHNRKDPEAGGGFFAYLYIFSLEEIDIELEADRIYEFIKTYAIDNNLKYYQVDFFYLAPDMYDQFDIDTTPKEIFKDDDGYLASGRMIAYASISADLIDYSEDETIVKEYIKTRIHY